MTRISELPPTSAVLQPGDLLEGERALDGASQKWRLDQLVRDYQPPAVRKYLYSDITGWPNATILAVSWQARHYDTAGFDVAGQPTRLRVPTGKGGLYLLTASLAWMFNQNGMRAVWFQINGVATSRLGQVQAAPISSTSADTIVRTSVVAPLNDGEYVEVIGYQVSGGLLGIGGAYGVNGPRSAASEFSLTRLGAEGPTVALLPGPDGPDLDEEPPEIDAGLPDPPIAEPKAGRRVR